MKRLVSGFSALLWLAVGAHADEQQKINPTDPQPTCPMCPGTYIPASEIDAYARKALDEKLLDQQVRDIDIGRPISASAWSIAAGWRSRRRIRSPSTTRSARSIM